jgi:hypothetical protein
LLQEEPDYGSGARAVERTNPNQPRYIRITDFGEDGIEPGHEYVTANPFEVGYELAGGDLLFARSGATVGKTYLHEDTTEPAIFAGYCIRFRLDPGKALPKFVYWFTKTEMYGRWVATIQRPAGQPNINREEFKKLRIPVPTLDEQERLVAAMESARAVRRAKLAEAKALLAGLDKVVHDLLGIAYIAKEARRVFAVREGEVAARFDPHFHWPAFTQNTQHLADQGGEPLGKLVAFSDEVWKPTSGEAPTFRYIEINGIDTATGEAFAKETPVVEAPSRARMVVHEGDIIVSLTRPYHGAIAKITAALEGCIASTGFSVLRSVDKRVSLDYLWCVLRSKLSLSQMLQRASGGNYPAITEQELAKVLIPVPPPSVQGAIAVEALRRRREAHRLQREAEAGWLTAKRCFEESLLEAGQQ